MRFLAAVLLFGAVLIAALPVAADGISHPGLGKEFFGISLDNKFDGGKTVDVWDSRSFLVENAFLSELRGDKFHHDGVIDWNFFERRSSVWSDWKGWSVDSPGSGWYKGGNKEDLGGTAVPEPGSLSFLLFGLAAVGFFAPRRTFRARTI
jgi:PEP-CTERM motif